MVIEAVREIRRGASEEFSLINNYFLFLFEECLVEKNLPFMSTSLLTFMLS